MANTGSEKYREEIEELLSLSLTEGQVKVLNDYLDKIEGINNELAEGKIDSEEAIKAIRELF